MFLDNKQHKGFIGVRKSGGVKACVHVYNSNTNVAKIESALFEFHVYKILTVYRRDDYMTQC